MGGKIGATLALDGEKEFTRAIKSASTSLKEFDSEMKLTQERTKGSANTIETLRQKHTVLQKTLDKQKEKSEALNSMVELQEQKYKKAGETLDKYKSDLEQAREELTKMKESGTASNEEIEEQEKKVASLEEKVRKGSSAYSSAENKLSSWKRQLNDSNTQVEKINSELQENDKYLREAEESTDGLATSIDEYGKATKEASEATNNYGETLAGIGNKALILEGIEKVAGTISSVGDAAYDAAKEMDAGYDIIVKKTGATGSTLKDFSTIANNIFSTMPVDITSIGTAVGEVNTKFGSTGEELERLSETFLQFAEINDQDVNSAIDNIQKDMAAFDLSVEDAVPLMDAMTAAGQRTGVSMDALQGQLSSNAEILQQLGMDAYGSIDFLADLEMSGADSSAVMTGLSKALKSATDEGIPLEEALAGLQDDLGNASSNTEALNYAYELFGTRAAPKVLNAIRNGKLDFKNLAQATRDYSGAVKDTYEETIDPWDEMTIAQNQLKLAGSELAQEALGTLAPAMTAASTLATKASKAFAAAPDPVKKFAGAVGAAVTIGSKAAPVISQSANLITSLQQARVLATIATNTMTVAETTNTVATEGATVAQIAINAAMAACPVVAIGLAIGGLAAAMYLLAGNSMGAATAQNEANQKIQDTITNTYNAQKAVEESAKQLDGAFTGLDESAGEIESKAGMAEELVSELEKLDDQTNLTAGDQQRMKTIIGELQTLYPGLSVEIDNATGHLRTATQEVRNYINEEKKTALLSAYQSAMSEAAEKLVNSKHALNDANEKLKESDAAIAQLEEDQMVILQDEADLHEKATKARQDYNDMLKEGTHSSEELQAAESKALELENSYASAQSSNAQALQNMSTQMDELKRSHDGLQESVNELQSEYDKTGEKFESTAQEMSDLETAITANSDAAGENKDAVEGTAEAYGTLGEEAGNASEKISSVTGETIKSFDELYTAALKDLNGTSDLFKDMSEGTETSLAEMNSALASQADYFSNYSANIQAATSDARYGTDENFRGLVNSIVAMGEDGAAYMDQFVQAMNGDQDAFNELLANFGNSEEAKMGAANSIAAVNENAQYEIGELNGTISDASGEIEGALVSIAETGANAYVETIANSGTDVTDRLATGMEEGSGTVADAAGNVADGTVEKFKSKDQEMQSTGKGNTEKYATGLTDAKGKATQAAGTISKEVLTKLKEIAPQAGNAGREIGNNYAAGISGTSSQVSSAAGTLSDTARDKLTQYKDSAYNWGAELGQNFANGLQSKVPAVSTAAGNVAKAAADPLHHSTPSIGPLKGDDQWGYELAVNFAGAMRRGIPQVTTAALELATEAAKVHNEYPTAAALQPRTAKIVTQTELTGISGDVSRAGIGSGSVNFVQNNYSPKALSRAEIYRDTRSQIAQVREMIAG